ncbi:MAG: hypothetical protein NC079_09150 [Clostridium sp.]|nr:hypothetical protein [Acetatifactor muris]MCM1527515.1 hypothetical protein [Bacteroides sp.]MCM1563757.1 hypothetical protein [Clostridium sp.]
MFQIFREEPWITAAIFGFMALSIFGRVLLGFLYQNMIREADNMATTDNRLLRQCKLKFANCYQLNNGVANIPVFVDKFLNKLALGPLSFDVLYHLSGQSMLLSVIFAGIGISKAIVDGRTLGEILPYYIVSFMGLYLHFSISSVVDIRNKRRVLKINLVDYLENHLSARMEVTESDMEMLFGETRSSGERNMRLAAAGRGGRRGKRTVELMPIGNREAPLSKNDSSVANETPAMAAPGMGAAASVPDPAGAFHISDEELEALIREFC